RQEILQNAHAFNLAAAPIFIDFACLSLFFWDNCVSRFFRGIIVFYQDLTSGIQHFIFRKN
ncbi:hypothetical protein ACJX0J_010111, partial [Zea mays]